MSPLDWRPDGRRYAAMGDAVTVPVATWIGRRLALVLDRAGAGVAEDIDELAA